MKRLFLLGLTLFQAPWATAAEDHLQFDRDIRPILSDKCFRCHGPDAATREANLRLDREDDAKANRDGHSAIIPGRLDESELIRRIETEIVEQRMPPTASGKSLSVEEIDRLRRWVAQGAEWSQPWSAVPPVSHPAPVVQDHAWGLNWIDGFVMAKLEENELRPALDADRTTLIRRLSIDLTGLPPTHSEVVAFLQDDSPNAYEKCIDRLLDSPRFGERMASYWFDLVRYASTVGYHGDQVHSITPYRDYVIAAFNANLPFDQFTREQLAGDLIPDATLMQRIASGYNRLLQTSHEGGVQPKEYLAIYGADRVRNLSGVWMAATMGCCQCHDHKFDPYSIKDFYSIQAFFADLDEAEHLTKGDNNSPTKRRPEIEVLSDSQQKDLEELAARRSSLTTDETSTAANAEALKQIEEQITLIKKGARLSMVSRSIAPRTIRILPRGNWLDDSGEIVQPAVPERFGKLDIGDRRATRLDLANWLTDDRQGVGGLTARVMVNRFWYLLFGRGLAPVLDDFGSQGEVPSHPELLDNLAIEFINRRWDVKAMLKEIAMSRTYRQSSYENRQTRALDPLNSLLSHQGRFRFPAETVRDSTLSISGLLVNQLEGPNAHPYQPEGYYRHLNFPERKYISDTGAGQWRRGVYLHWQRQFLHPMLKAFDAPSREECTAQRQRSNTPLSALVLLNDPTFLEASRAFAARILTESGESPEERLRFAFNEAVSRSPSPKEMEVFKHLIEQSLKEFSEDRKAARELLSVGLKPLPEGTDQSQLAAWAVIARAVLSLNEAMTRF
ncbi:PSD1 and planctomycete cytochrome C domain-containing protein [Schlesneria sp. T3-172]|uniref:PSD1 and planctomycete cytochrome C domain-containing protein n=1 Tax=Schlesneria sphaerica TaxID=3373610 RepID=UPI0037C6CC9E